MTIIKLCADSVETVCIGCGALSVHELVDLEATGMSIHFPWCAACGKTRTSAHVTPGAIECGNTDANERQAANKALHAELVRLERVTPGLDIPEDAYVGAKVWPVDNAFVAVPLTSDTQAHYEAWLAQQ